MSENCKACGKEFGSDLPRCMPGSNYCAECADKSAQQIERLAAIREVEIEIDGYWYTCFPLGMFNEAVHGIPRKLSVN